MKALLVLLGLCALGVLAGGRLGHRHPVGDSLAPFRTHAAVAALAATLLVLPWIPSWASLLMGAPAIAVLAAPLMRALLQGEPAPGEVAVYSKNLKLDRDGVASVVFDVEGTRPDVVLLQELGPSSEDLLPLLAEAYPTRHRCENPWIGQTAILSRWSALPGTEGCVEGASVLRVMAPAGPLWLVSVHLRWPWPEGQLEQARRLADALRGLEGPTVVAGDFNGAAWSHAARLIGEAVGARALAPVGSTHRIAGVVPVALDHVLVTGSGTLERRPLAGSDHNGLLARVAPFGAAQAPMSAASKG